MNVGSGSKIDVHTVLKLIAEAITAMRHSFGPSGGSGTSSTCKDFRGSFSAESMPSNISCSSLRTNAALTLSGILRAAMSSLDARSRTACLIESMSPATLKPLLAV
jgi:hypothetical protein